MRKKLLTIVALLLFVATGAWAQEPTKYTVKMAEGTEDATNWTISPAEAAEGSTVTATYSGTKRVKSVKAVTKAPTETVVDLSKLTANYTAKDGDVLTNSTTKYRVTIADGAKVTLDGASISGKNFCIKCAGSATIILKDGTTNTLTSTSTSYPALWAGNAGTTLTIQGSTGALNVTSGYYMAGIGGGCENKNKTCGDIKIEGGVITAQGGTDGAGIGSDCYGTCGNITITGGTITANGGTDAAGIGSGYGANPTSCGNITITSGVTKVTATKGERAPYSIGKGAGEKAKCGTVTIGGTVYEKGISDSPYTYPSTEPEGLLKGQFSVSAEKKVQFSKGNLCYDSSSGTWSFFDNQYQYYKDYTATYWDKFGWVATTSTVLTDAPAKYGASTSTTDSDYGSSTSDTPNNWGETMGAGWRVLTKDEWAYLFNTRTTGGTVFGTASARYAHAEVNTDGTATKGIILFPDGVDIANSEVTTTGTVNNTSIWGTKCTIAQWTALAAKGCVFLPAAGKRNGTTVNNVGEWGYYWTSSPYSSEASSANCASFLSNNLNPDVNIGRKGGCSVRLVYDVK